MNRSERGFSLIEALVTVVIVGIAFVIFVTGMGTSVLTSDYHRKQAVSQASIRNLAESVKAADYVDCATPDSYGSSAGAGFTNVAAPTAPSVRTLDTAGQLVTFFASAANTSFTEPTGMTKRYDYASPTSSNAVTASAADVALTNSGATSPRSATAGTPADAVAQSVALDSQHSGPGIQFVGETHGRGTTTALALTVPSGGGTIRLAQIAVRGDSSATVTPPAGWTLLLSTAANNSVRSLLYASTTASSGTATWALSAPRETSGGIVSYGGTSTYTTKVTSVRYWRASGTPPTTFLANGAACPSADNGLQLVSLHVNSADNRSTQDLEIVKRKP